MESSPKHNKLPYCLFYRKLPIFSLIIWWTSPAKFLLYKIYLIPLLRIYTEIFKALNYPRKKKPSLLSDLAQVRDLNKAPFLRPRQGAVIIIISPSLIVGLKQKFTTFQAVGVTFLIGAKGGCLVRGPDQH